MLSVLWEGDRQTITGVPLRLDPSLNDTAYMAVDERTEPNTRIKALRDAFRAP